MKISVSLRKYTEEHMNTSRLKTLFMLLLFCGVCYTSFAQEELAVSGVVKDTKSKPLAGVQVSVKGTSQSTHTDFEGLYTITLTKGQTLVFSLQGMQSQEVTPSSATVDVTLLAQGEEGTKKKAGTPMNTNTRGQTSIVQTVKPLWVLNGVILQGDIDLKPEDLVSDDAKSLIASAIPGLTAESIESFRVINDASATAYYGPRAIAGVVEIVTKKGTAGSSSFTYSNESTYRLIPSYKQYNIMNSQDQMSFVQEMMRKGMMPTESYKTYTLKGAVGRMYELYNILDANGNPRVANTEEGRLAYMRAAEHRNTNWFKELFQSSVMQNHTLSFSSGGEKSAYYTSLSVLSDPGWQKGEELTQYAGNLNATYNFSSKLSLNVITDISYQEKRSNGKNMYEYALGTPRTMDPKDDYAYYYAPFNIHRERENNFMTTDLATLRLQAQLSYKISPKVEATLMGAIRYESGVYNTDITENSNIAQSYRAINESIRENNDYLYKDPNNPFAIPEIVMPQGGKRTKQVTTFNGNNLRATLNYNDSFSDGLHLLNLYGGFDMDNAKNSNDTNHNYGVLFNSGHLEAYSYLFLKYLQERSEGYYNISNTVNNNQAFFGNASYTYGNRYTLNGTLRYDASNQFAPSRLIRWMPTWNVGLTWDVSQEKFFTHLTPVFSYLNIYTSLGLTAVSPYATNSYTQLYYDLPWRNSSVREKGIYRSNLANRDLTYEKTQEINVGTQFGLLNYRLNVSLEWFKRRSYDLIGSVITQGVGGQISKYGNIAEMQTQGLEAGLETINIKTEDFSWKTSLVYSRAINKITKLNTAPTVGDMVGYSGSGGFAREGYPQGSLFSVPFNGLDSEGLPTFIGPDGNPTHFGVDMKERNVDFLKYSGTLIPTDKGSFSNTFNYKGLSFGIVFTYSWGNVVRLRDVSSIYSGLYSDVTTLPNELKNRWQFAGDENKTNIPAIYTSAQEYNYDYKNLTEHAYRAYDYSDVRIAKGDNIRLKEISVGYTFDKNFLQETRIRQLSVKLQATNVALLYADKRLNGDDPDFRATGIYVAPKRIIFTLRLGL
jgi:hypothetical protein